MLALGCFLAPSAGQAAASHVSCGATITADTTLDNDLVDCPTNGIIIAADDVTLDLNGHTIDGDGTPDSACDPIHDFCDFGVAFDNRDGVTVRDGSIREFEGGLLAFKTRDSRLIKLSTARNRFGNIGVAASSLVLVRKCSGDASQPPARATAWACSTRATSELWTAPSAVTLMLGSSRSVPRTA